MKQATLELEAQVRTSHGRHTRLTGRIPAICYGKSFPSQQLDLEYNGFRKLYSTAGFNTIIELNLGGKSVPVLVHDIQFDPVSDRISHVDFIAIDMSKEVKTKVKIVTVGVCPAVKNLGGILDIKKHEIEIKCLPKDLIHSIEVDVTPIVDFHTSIHVKDLKVPSGIKIMDEPEDTVVTASAIKIEEEAPAAAAVPAEGAAPAAEGAAAPAAGAGEKATPEKK